MTLHATLTYIFFVTPPPEAKERMQQGIIARIRAAITQEEKDAILKTEIPTRMNSMNAMEATCPPSVMAKLSKTVPIAAR